MAKVIIEQKDVMFAMLKGITRTYYREIIKNTPGNKRQVADAWEIDIVNDTIVISNEEFGQIVTYLEEGTQPHEIKPNKKKALRFFIDDKEIFTKKVNHPGIQARRWIQTAVFSLELKKQFEKIFEEEMERIIAKKL